VPKLAAQGAGAAALSYQGFASAWPSMTGEFADKMNGLGKGKRLFNDGMLRQALRLVEAQPVGSAGVLTLVYRLA
jgi:hypothetical protein